MSLQGSAETRDSSPWWLTEPFKAHERLPSYIDSLLQLNNKRFLDYVRYAGLYGNYEAMPIIGSFLANGLPYGRTFKRLSFNVCQSMVDTVMNQRASDFGRLKAVSADGTFKQFMMAKQLTKALRTEYKANNVEFKFTNWVKDALVFGNGLMGVSKDFALDKNGKPTGKLARPVINRNFIPEFVIDPYENVTDTFTHVINRVRYVNKQNLIAQFPEHKEAILRAATEPSNYLRVRGDENIRVDWSCVPARGSVMGRVAMCIEGATLIDEDYPYDTPPFVNLPWSTPFQGWYAQGLVDQLMATQLEINELIEIIRQAQHLFAHPFMLIENSTNVNTAHIQDIPGKLIKYNSAGAGTEPKIVAPMVLSPEIYSHLDRLYGKAYEVAGISPYDAQSKTMPRMESSKAIRAATSIGDIRHFSFGRACEEGMEKIGAMYVRVAAECGAENDYVTRMPHSTYFPSFSWKEIQQDITNYNIEIDTVNASDDSAASKMQDIQDMTMLGQMSPQEQTQYLDNPDVERAKKMATASADYIDWALHKMTIDGEPMDPDDFCDTQNAIKVCVEHWLIGERLGWEHPHARQNLLDFILALKQIAAPDVAQMPPGATPMQASAPANPLNAGMPPPAGQPPAGGGQA